MVSADPCDLVGFMNNEASRPNRSHGGLKRMKIQGTGVPKL